MNSAYQVTDSRKVGSTDVVKKKKLYFFWGEGGLSHGACAGIFSRRLKNYYRYGGTSHECLFVSLLGSFLDWGLGRGQRRTVLPPVYASVQLVIISSG